MKKIALGILIGILLTLGWNFIGDNLLSKTYTVKSIQSHYPHDDRNSETRLTVYLAGNSGHTKQMMCAFPPNLELNGDEKNGWTGLRKIRVRGEAQRYMFGPVSYYADKIEYG